MGGAERAAGAREYRGISEVLGPLVIVRGAGSVGFNELAEVRGADGETRLGLVLETSAARAFRVEGDARARLRRHRAPARRRP